jgi:hypothetical protein
MDRASIVESLGSTAGSILMKKPILALVALVALLSGVVAWGQEAPLRGVGLLALNAADAQSGLGNAQSHGELVETPDSGGGGGTTTRNGRGAGDVGPAARLPRAAQAPVQTVPDELPPAALPHGDPATPAAATPKRPSYRWQSLVPGAIK